MEDSKKNSLLTDRPYLETKEHVGVFWVLEAADLNEALARGRKAARPKKARPSEDRLQNHPAVHDERH